MAGKKSKALANAEKVLAARQKKQKEKGTQGGKATVPVVGKSQMEILDVVMGKDNFDNKAYNFELKVTGGVNQGRKFSKSLGLEANEPPKNFTEEDVINWTFDALEKVGVTNPLDRDEVEGLVGSVIEVNFHKKSDAAATKWPNIYFQSLISTGEVEDEDVTPDDPAPVVEMDGDDEFDFMEVK